MTICLKNGNVYTEKGFKKQDIYCHNGKVSLQPELADENCLVIYDVTDKYIVPGFVDVHVHLREPGFSYKETIYTGSRAAAKGGYTTVCTMPNLKPAPVDLKTLNEQLDIIKKDSVIRIIPYGAITSKQDGKSGLSKMEEMAPFVVGFTDDGVGVQTQERMIEAMKLAKKLDLPIVAHCEDEELVQNGYIHKGKYCMENGHRGISSESEWKQVERDVALAQQIGCRYHVCHVSTRESVDIIKKARENALGNTGQSNITAETAPHYLLLTHDEIKEEGRFKMNPPIRDAEDRDRLIEGIVNGEISVIATDHAPHSTEEKEKGLEKSAFGIVGLETSFPLLYTYLVKTGKLTLDKLIDVMSVNPREIFRLPGYKTPYVQEGSIADLTVIDLTKEWEISGSEFVSKGKATPFEGWRVCGQIVQTIADGEVVYEISE